MHTKIKTVLGIAFLAVATSSLAAAQSFSYPDFSSTSGLVLNGDAAQSGNVLRVTAAAGSKAGSAYHGQEIRVSDGFETMFEFQLTQLNCGGADGLTFIIHNDSRGTAFLGDGGGEIAYSAASSSPPGTGALNSLVIELDTYMNGADISSNEISVHTNGVAENGSSEALSIGSADASVNMKDGLVHLLLISYLPGQLEVYIDDMTTPKLSVAYDFATGGTWLGGGTVGGLDLIGDTDAYVGFTAATGGCWENHDLLSWFWEPNVPGTGYCFGDPGSGMACPCANDNDGSVPGSGCANGVFSSGAQLFASGSASVSSDTVVLAATGLDPNQLCLYFQAENDLFPGLIWGDGLRCTGGALKRLGTEFADGAGASTTSSWTTPISIDAGNVFPGDTKYYQCWYVNTTNPACGAGINDYNTTNGYAITWAP
jgi:hypothetical protein